MIEKIKSWLKSFRDKRKKKETKSEEPIYGKLDLASDAALLSINTQPSKVNHGDFGGGGASGSWDEVPKPKPVPPTETSNLYSSSSYTSTVNGTSVDYTPKDSSVFDSIGDTISEVASSIGDTL